MSTQARRLPVYFLVDTSGSMQGDPINQVASQLGVVIDGLRANPQALETAHLCLITFGSSAKVEVPLTSLETFNIPTHLDASGSTAMGEALQLICRTRASDLNRKTASSSGDWRPMVFLMTDGIPTDDFDAGLAEFKRQRWGVRVACAVNGAEEDNLRKFLDNSGATRGTPDETSNLVHISTTDSMQMQAFFKWVSDSISAASNSQDPDGMAGGAPPSTGGGTPPPPIPGGGNVLPPPPPTLI
jgi:uncharacterized protein YegL